MKETRTAVSLSLQKCLTSGQYLQPIIDMVEAVTWSATNLMWMVNLVILKHLESGIDPPPLCRDLFMDCYTHSCKPVPRNTTHNRQLETDYFKLAVEGIRRKRYMDLPSYQGDRKRRKLSQFNEDEVAAMENIPLSPKSMVSAWKNAYNQDVKREQRFHSMGSWHGILNDVKRDLDGLSHTTSWRPHHKQLNGESDQMEQLVKSELIPNSVTYISETYKPRRRFYFETKLKPFFKHKSHVSRVATELMRITDGIKGARIVNGAIDWASVFTRVRTTSLRQSFREELDTATQQHNFNAFCIGLVQSFPQPLSATTHNLKEEPHVLASPSCNATGP